jgi:hypothetical protein
MAGAEALVVAEIMEGVEITAVVAVMMEVETAVAVMMMEVETAVAAEEMTTAAVGTMGAGVVTMARMTSPAMPTWTVWCSRSGHRARWA